MMQLDALRSLVCAALEDTKAVDIAELDVRGLTVVMDYMIVAGGTSNRHVKALADHLVEKAAEQGVKPIGLEGDNDAEWVLVDLGDIVVHIMLPDIRAFYNLEKLWDQDLAKSVDDNRR